MAGFFRVTDECVGMGADICQQHILENKVNLPDSRSHIRKRSVFVIHLASAFPHFLCMAKGRRIEHGVA